MFARGHRRPSTVWGRGAVGGTAVGAGIFGLPYVFAQAGVAVGVTYVLGLGAVLGLVNLAYGSRPEYGRHPSIRTCNAT